MNFNYKFLLTAAVISLIGNSFADEQNTLNVAAPDATQPAVVAQQDVTVNNQPVHNSAETSSESDKALEKLSERVDEMQHVLEGTTNQVINCLGNDVRRVLDDMENSIKATMSKYKSLKLADGSSRIISSSTVSKNKDLDEFSQENKNVLEEKVQKINERNGNIIDIVMGYKEQTSPAS